MKRWMWMFDPVCLNCALPECNCKEPAVPHVVLLTAWLFWLGFFGGLWIFL